ncbi:MAG: zf-HC2 domain-containing protein [Blastocatellia bacterium]
MRDQHITSLLEEEPLSRLSDDERAMIEAHVAACSECSQSYRAARLAESLIVARAAETQTVSPFFKTRVMAAIRDRQLSPEPAAWLRIWRAAGSLLVMMTMLVIVLVGVSVFNSATTALPSPDIAINQSIYSTDEVIFGPDDAGEETYDQVFGTIYGSEDGDGN